MPEIDYPTALAHQMYVQGYRRGYDIATARAESRRRLGLPIEPGTTGVACDQCEQLFPRREMAAEPPRLCVSCFNGQPDA